MSNEEILNLWDCNKLTCGEVVEVARADERAKITKELETIINRLGNVNSFDENDDHLTYVGFYCAVRDLVGIKEVDR